MKKSKVATPASDMPRTPKDAMAPAEKPEMSEEDKIREGGYDLDHLMRAEEIKSDPKRMEHVHKAHKKKLTAMKSIADLKMAGQALAHKKKMDAKEEMGEKNESPAEEASEPAPKKKK